MVHVSTSLQAAAVENDLSDDPRWQLIERILATGPFQKSGRLRELLPYLAERAIHGDSHDLTEHNIGIAVFNKPVDYSPVDDSSVRVHARQLRLKLHEYFDGEGRNEHMVVEIPKGSYVPVFRAVRDSLPEPVPVPLHSVEPALPAKNIPWKLILPWSLIAVLAIGWCVLLTSQFWSHTRKDISWPLSEVFVQNESTHIVIADVNYGMLRIISQQEGSLEQYLRPNLQQALTPSGLSPREARILNYISSSNLTSYADVVVATTLSNLVSGSGNYVTVRSARDIRLRDLEEGNYVFVGSPSSNPWVSLYQSRLNFIEREGVVGESKKYFVNQHPHPGEQENYQGLEFTGSAGEDYATISLLPTSSGRGSVLILQGLQQEGTEAAGIFITTSDSGEKIREALGLKGKVTNPVHFELLIRTRAVAGAPNATSIVAARLLP